jgi:beta-1,2-mannobiose phosphorylase / 1,2-beta-oligomannan phosphorylase
MNQPHYVIERIGVLMTADPTDAKEAWGVLNPASARGRDGQIYLFPRLVAKGNVSRIGRARVIYDDEGVPRSVERLGIILEPDESWERNDLGGGVEDPRITFVPRLDQYVMAYTAYGPLGPRVALAVSPDLVSWTRLGPLSLAYDSQLGVDFQLIPNKDAMLFPEPVAGPDGTPSYALLHRPMWDLSWIRDGASEPLPRGLSDPRPGIWVSFVPASKVESDLGALLAMDRHRLVALPEQPWEALKIGGGTVPVRVADGWLTIYHGVAGELIRETVLQPKVRYAAGVLILDDADVSRVLARSTQPLLEPEVSEERQGIVPNVVFPTALEPVTDDEAFVFYGMADSRIGSARLRRIAG